MAIQQDFDYQRERSKVYERAFANWLQAQRGYMTLATYDFSGSEDAKAPMLFCGRRRLVIPDLQAWRPNRTLVWFEIKVKEQAVLYRKLNTITTGIELRHWQHYHEVSEATNADVWLVFIHEAEGVVVTGEISDMPISHQYNGNKMGRGGMIFFDFNKLYRLMTLEQLNFYIR